MTTTTTIATDGDAQFSALGRHSQRDDQRRAITSIQPIGGTRK